MGVEIVEQDLGGARVRRTFTNGARHLKAGEQLSRDDLLDVPRANRRALTDAGYIEPYPRAPETEPGERIIVGVGKDKYNVIEGRVLNKTPLSRSEAEELARQ